MSKQVIKPIEKRIDSFYNGKHYFIVFDDNNNGYSLGCHCQNCLNKAINNSKILDQSLSIKRIFPNPYNVSRCVFCSSELPMMKLEELESHKEALQKQLTHFQECLERAKNESQKLIPEMKRFDELDSEKKNQFLDVFETENSYEQDCYDTKQWILKTRKLIIEILN